MEGHKELLGLWMSENEGAKFWLNVLTELQNRGVKDILIACVDGLKGFPDAIQAVYPQTQIQLCIVHMVRNSMRYVPWKDYKAIAADLKQIYQATTEEEALLALDRFCEKWDAKYPRQIGRSWRTHWENLNTLFKLSCRHTQSDLYDQRNRITEQCHTPKRSKSESYFQRMTAAKKVSLLGDSAGIQEMDSCR